MHQRADSAHQEMELWTRDDAESWKDAELNSGSEAWMDDDCLLDNDLWTESQSGEELSMSGLRRLGIRMS